MGENHACAVCVKPSSPANMEDNLAVTNGEVINIARLGETVGLKVMPSLPTQITLIKIYVNDTNLQACLGQCAGMFFFDVGYFKQVENALGENHTCQGLIDGCGCIVCHAAKVANFLESLPLRSDILVRHRLGSSTDFCAWAQNHFNLCKRFTCGNKVPLHPNKFKGPPQDKFSRGLISQLLN